MENEVFITVIFVGVELLVYVIVPKSLVIGDLALDHMDQW